MSSSRRANPGTTVHLAVSLQLSQEFSALAQCYLFFRVLAADQRDARYAFAQRVMASSLLTPCAPWPVGFLGGALSKREVRALKLPLTFDMNVTRRCFSASVAHAFSAGKTKALKGCLIVAQQHRNNEGHMRCLDDLSSCFYTRHCPRRTVLL